MTTAPKQWSTRPREKPKGKRGAPRGKRVDGVTLWVRLPAYNAELIDELKPDFGGVSGVVRDIIDKATTAGYFDTPSSHFVLVSEAHAALIGNLVDEFGSPGAVIAAVIEDAAKGGWFGTQEEAKHNGD